MEEVNIEKKEEFKLIKNTERDVEIEVLEAKEIPNLIRKKLIEKNIDAYVYTPHPQLNGPRIHVTSSNPIKDLISASEDVESDLNEFKKLIIEAFRESSKKEEKEKKENKK